MNAIRFEWRGEFTNDEMNALDAEAFETREFTAGAGLLLHHHLQLHRSERRLIALQEGAS